MIVSVLQQHSSLFSQYTTWEECKHVLQSICLELLDSMEPMFQLYFFSTQKINHKPLPLSFLQQIHTLCSALVEYKFWNTESEFIYFIELASIHFLDKSQWFPLIQSIIRKDIQQVEEIEESIYYQIILRQDLESLPQPIQWCMKYFSFLSKQLLLTIEYECCNKLILSIFDVIKVYPQNEKSLNILKVGISHLKNILQNSLFENLKASFEKRLLFAGASTSAILDQFVNLICSLHQIDSKLISFSLDAFATIFSLFCNYLQKNRKHDFYTCLLSRTLQPQDDFFTFLTTKQETGFDVMDYLFQLATNPETQSKEELLHAYQYQMALKCFSFFEKEEWNSIALAHEWMKLRLGYKQVLPVEIMLKDVSDSKRLNQRSNQTMIHSLLLSRNYWPESFFELFLNNPYFEQEETYQLSKNQNIYQLHPQIQQQLQHYEQYFDQIKAPRYLLWIPCLSQIDLEIELHDTSTLTLTLHPLDASIVLYFQQQSQWTISQLCEQLQFVEDPQIILQKCQSLHVILTQLNDDTFQLVA